MKSVLLASAATALAVAFINDVTETVMVKGAGGSPVRLNKSDFDADQADGGAKQYTLHKDEQPAPIVGEGVIPVNPALTIPPAPSAPHSINPVAPDTASSDTLMVASNGLKGKSLLFFVVRPDGSRVEDMRDVDKEGYATEAEAWTAVMAVKRQPFEQHLSPPPGMPPAPVLPPV